MNLRPTLSLILAFALSSPLFAQGSDSCATATLISGTGAFAFNNQTATPTTADYSACGIARDVWFRWTAPQSGLVVVSTCGTAENNTVVAIYPGAACSGAPIACVDDTCGAQGTLTFSAAAGVQYKIRMGSHWSAGAGWYGAFTINYSNPVQNEDSCQFALPISGVGTFAFDTTDATNDVADPTACLPYYRPIFKDVWFRWTAPLSGLADVTTCGQGALFDTLVTAYAGAACAPSEQPLACNDNDANCPERLLSTINFPVQAGQVYRIRVGGTSDQQFGPGSIDVSVTPDVMNDECATATVIAGTGTFPFNNATATGDDYIGRDVWFRWTAPASAPTYISTCPTLMQSGLAVYPNVCPAPAQSIAANDDDPGCGTSSRVDFQAAAGETYLIRIGSIWGFDFTTDGYFIVDQNLGAGSGGETITVTTTYDDVDFTGFRSVTELPGPDGRVSFREAFVAANNTPGPQTIAFAIPRSEWYYDTSNYAELINRDGAVYLVTDGNLTVDGATQTQNIGDTNPNGPEVGFWSWNPNAAGSPHFIVRADNCTFKDLAGSGYMGYDFWLEGDNNRIVGCALSWALHGAIKVTGNNNVIGGVLPSEGNRLGSFQMGYGVSVEGGAQNTVVQGNFIVARSTGIAVSGATGTRIGGPEEAARNIIADVGSYCCEGYPTGTYVSFSSAIDTRFENNWIGTADGLIASFAPGTTGLTIANCTGTTVRNNLISGVYATGFDHFAGQVFGTALAIGANSGTLIEDNLIGTDASGQAPLRSLFNIVANGVQTSLLISGNTIAFAERAGVTVATAATGVALSGNSIHDNVLLGIDLDPVGVTPNDTGDGDIGGNGLQNFPLITAALGDGAAQSRVEGTLNSLPNQSFIIECFANTACDPSGYGEGARFLGSVVVTTDAAGFAEFVANLAAPAQPGEFATATATRVASGDTSEFSACVAFAAFPVFCQGDANRDGDVNFGDVTAVLASFGAQGLPGMPGDADYNGEVNFNDISTALANWNTNCP